MADQFLTLMDLKNSMSPGDAAIASVAEIIAKENEILDDVPWVEGNLVTGDVSFIREALPKAKVRKINEGIEATASKKKSKTETCVLISDRGIVDMNELKVAPDKEKYLLQENKAHIISLGEIFAEMIIYGNDAEAITGFSARYNKLSGPYASQIVNAGGAGNNLSSIYFVNWDPDEVVGIYPKNAIGGLEVLPQSNIYMPEPGTDNPRKQLLCHVTEYNWFVGLKIRDHRYVSRLCNIAPDISNDVLFEKFITAKNKIPKRHRLTAVAYMSPDLYTRFECAAFAKSNANISYKDDIQNNTQIVSLAGIKVKENDCQLAPEKQVA